MTHIKHCNKCNTDKPLSEYQKHIKNGINIGQSYCRDCRNSNIFLQNIRSISRENIRHLKGRPLLL